MSSSKDNVRCYRDTMTNNYDDSVTASEVFPVESFSACACSLCRSIPTCGDCCSSGCPSGATGATGATGHTGATGSNIFVETAEILGAVFDNLMAQYNRKRLQVAALRILKLIALFL